jgi:hypothetical protein
LEGGKSHQKRFLSELRRVLAPLGMVLLTTPNYWYPYDAHSDLYLPQFIPHPLRDTYLRMRNPSFLEEHGSFDAIQLLTPGFFRSALEECSLSPLHQLPCCLDKREYIRINPLRGALAYLGLGWYFHAEFWTVVVHGKMKLRLRRKLRNSWFYERNQPSTPEQLSEFSAGIDFEQGMFNHQLGCGWHWFERDKRAFRWIEKDAICYLQTREEVRYIHVTGYSPLENRILVHVDGILVGEHAIGAESSIQIKYLLPFAETRNRIFKVRVQAQFSFTPQESEDERTLPLMIFSLRLSP